MNFGDLCYIVIDYAALCGLAMVVVYSGDGYVVTFITFSIGFVVYYKCFGYVVNS